MPTSLSFIDLYTSSYSKNNEWMNCTGNRSLNNLIFTNKVDSDFLQKSFLYAMDDHGCLVTCIAMLLRNIGATTSSKYDYRSNSTKSILEADPYSVGMANLFKNDSNKWYSTSSNKIEDPYISYKPFLATYSNITAAFGYSIPLPNLPTEINTPIKKVQYIHDQLQLHPEGIIIGFSGHYIVVTKSNFRPDASNIDSCFTVCDPVNGEETNFVDAWIASCNKKICDIISVCTIS